MDHDEAGGPQLPQLGNELRRLRRARKMTQSEVASRAGVSDGFIAMLESGRRRPKPVTLKKVAEVLRCTPKQQDLLMSLLIQDGNPTQRTAMTSSVHIQPNEVRVAARGLHDCLAQLESLVAQVAHISRQIDAAWGGAAADAFREKAEGWIGTQRRSADLLADLAKAVANWAQKLEELDSTLAETLRI